MRTPLALLAAALLAPLALALPAAAQPQSLTTLFSGGNGGNSGWGTFFDVTVATPGGVRIVAFDVNAGAAGSTPFTIEVWTTPSTYVGKDGNAAAWTKVTSGAGVSAGPNLPSTVDVADFVLAPGSYGVAIYYEGTSVSYTDGNGSNQNFANADLALQLGLVRTALFGGSTYSPRVWNGTVHYARPSDAAYGVLGTGCAGSNGVPQLAAASGSLPKLGTTFTVNVSGMPTAGGPASMLFGFSKQSWGATPLPFDAGVIGMTGCTLRVGFVLALGINNVAGSGSFALKVPNNLSLVGQQILHQAFVFDPGANPAGATLSNAGEGQVGL